MRPSSYVLHLAECILCPVECVLCPSSSVLHPTECNESPSSYVLRPSCSVLHWCSYPLHPSETHENRAKCRGVCSVNAGASWIYREWSLGFAGQEGLNGQPSQFFFRALLRR